LIWSIRYFLQISHKPYLLDARLKPLMQQRPKGQAATVLDGKIVKNLHIKWGWEILTLIQGVKSCIKNQES
jgi:hypothetical protein